MEILPLPCEACSNVWKTFLVKKRGEFFPDNQFKPPRVQLEAVSSCSIASNLGEETDPDFATSSF